LRRGDLVLAAAPGDYGKPRPAVVVQRDLTEPLESIIVCPLTSDLVPSKHVRPAIQPDESNGLHSVSQVMVDKVGSIHVRRTRERIGALSPSEMDAVDFALAAVLGLERL
jgi:mRNA interferase MazF